jgi:isocitrate/isopropylmalate dehydrogenase
VRENTEDAYAGMHGFAHKGQPTRSRRRRWSTRAAAVERILRFAFEKPRERDK